MPSAGIAPFVRDCGGAYETLLTRVIRICDQYSVEAAELRAA